jgi:hypothetical protein
MQNQLWVPPSGHNPFEHNSPDSPDVVSFTARGHKIAKCEALFPAPQSTYYRTMLDTLLIVIASQLETATGTQIWRPVTQMPDVVYVGFVLVIKEYEHGQHGTSQILC